ncbi:hypothetical protein LguiA_029445 [Lonicera macranthoides]
MAFWENRYTLPSNMESNYCKAAATLTGLLTFAYSYCRKVISHAWTSDDDVMHRRQGTSAWPKLVRFATGQQRGYFSSWPLFALCHNFLVWYCADKVHPGRKFQKYALPLTLLGDDIVLGDPKVADLYMSVMTELGVKISTPKSWIGGLGFSKKFFIKDCNLSLISVKMLRSARQAVAWIQVCKSVGVPDLRTTLRLRGTGYRRYSSRPEHINPNYNRH